MQNRMLLSFALTFCLLCIALGTQGQQTITFHLDLKKALQNEHSFQSVGLRGSLPPLSWEKTTDLTDEDGDGIYTGTFTFPDLSKGRRVEYKYVLDGEMEFDPGDPRWWLSGASLEGGPKDEWNLYRAKTAEEVAQLKFSRAEVMADLAILEEALRTLHPGLYRYNDSLEMEERFAQLRQEISEYTTPGELYATLSRFTATIRCGHTYPNYFNQGAMVQQVVLRQPDKLPFTFQWFGDRMLTMDNASANEQLDFGAEIRSINGVPVAEIQQAILPMMKADGGNDGNRLHQMNLTGKGRYEAFDSYFPLLFPPVAGKFEINAKRLSDGQSFTTTVAAMKRTDRAAKIEEQKSAPASKAPWRLEFLAPDIAYLRMETFSTWEFDFDWKQWIATAFDEIREKNVAHLIVDIRNNEGGTTEVVKVLTEQIATTELSSELGMDRTRATAKPANLAPYLGTWEDLFETQKGNFEYVGNGFYKFKTARMYGGMVKPVKTPYSGKVYLLMGPSNSSATFYLCRTWKRNGLATLVGSETGGNQQGTNGGYLYLLYLPNTHVEIDVPLIGTFQAAGEPDRGLLPDVEIQLSVEDYLVGRDTALEKVLSLIKSE